VYIIVKTSLGYLLILLKELGDVISYKVKNALSSREREPSSRQVNFIAAFKDMTNISDI
jgi:hypothetical protein